jgi:uncharacterized protein (DUF433 family)
MTLSIEQVESSIVHWTATKKAELLSFILKNMGEPALGIEKTKGVCGGSACIIRTRIPVWTLVSLKNDGAADAILLDAYPSLRQQDLNNAWAYYKAQKKEIDLDIKENHEA